MGTTLEIFFCIPKCPLDDDFIAGLTDILKKHKFSYNKWGAGRYIYTSEQDWISEDEVDGDPTGERLKKAIKTTSTLGGGAIDFGCLFGEEPVGGYISILPYHLDPAWLVILFMTPAGYYRDESAMKNFIALSESLYAFLKPVVGYIDVNLGVPPSLFDTIKNSAINDIAAINFIHPAIVEDFGRKKLLSAPAWKVKELDDGGMLMILTPDPLNAHEVDEKKIQLRKFFGLK